MPNSLPSPAALEALRQGCGLPSKTSIVVERLGAEPASVSLCPGLDIYPASVIKLPLVAAALADVEAGRLSLEALHAVTPANMTANDAESPLVPGYSATLEELCRRAISRSDNVATNMLFDIVGRERATAIVRDRFGLHATAFHRKLSGADPLIVDPEWDRVHMNSHPAADAARLLKAIEAESVPSARLQRSYLAQQFWNNKLSGGLDPSDRFDHKTGETSQVTHDAGILTTAAGSTFIIVVYTQSPGGEERHEPLAAFMKALRTKLVG